MIHFSPLTRLPMAIKWSDGLEAEVKFIYNRFYQTSSISEKMDTVVEAVKLNARIGSLFTPLSQGVKLSPSAISYVKQLLTSLQNGKPMDDICLSDRLSLLSHSESVMYIDPQWTTDELEVINRYGIMNPADLFTVFAKGPGVDQYLTLLRIRTLGA